MTISIRLDDIDGVLLKKYAENLDLSVSEFVRRLLNNYLDHEYNELLKKVREDKEKSEFRKRDFIESERRENM